MLQRQLWPSGPQSSKCKPGTPYCRCRPTSHALTTPCTSFPEQQASPDVTAEAHCTHGTAPRPASSDIADVLLPLANVTASGPCTPAQPQPQLRHPPGSCYHDGDDAGTRSPSNKPPGLGSGVAGQRSSGLAGRRSHPSLAVAASAAGVAASKSQADVTLLVGNPLFNTPEPAAARACVGGSPDSPSSSPSLCSPVREAGRSSPCLQSPPGSPLQLQAEPEAQCGATSHSLDLHTRECDVAAETVRRCDAGTQTAAEETTGELGEAVVGAAAEQGSCAAAQRGAAPPALLFSGSPCGGLYAVAEEKPQPPPSGSPSAAAAGSGTVYHIGFAEARSRRGSRLPPPPAPLQLHASPRRPSQGALASPAPATHGPGSAPTLPRVPASPRIPSTRSFRAAAPATADTAAPVQSAVGPPPPLSARAPGFARSASQRPSHITATIGPALMHATSLATGSAARASGAWPPAAAARSPGAPVVEAGPSFMRPTRSAVQRLSAGGVAASGGVWDAASAADETSSWRSVAGGSWRLRTGCQGRAKEELVAAGSGAAACAWAG
jgi:hypothetical protein